MLTLQPNPTFRLPVKICVAGGKPQTVTFEFKFMTRDEWNAFQAPEIADKRSNLDTLMEILKGWDEKDIDEPFSREAVSKLSNVYFGSSYAIAEAYGAELTRARPGN